MKCPFCDSVESHWLSDIKRDDTWSERVNEIRVCDQCSKVFEITVEKN